MIYESVIENLTLMPEVITKGAKRIELCDNLAVGGTTPSHGVMKYGIEYAHEKDVSIAIMIRPRGGDFIYNDREINVMEDDIFQAQSLAADAVVFCALTNSGDIDINVMQQLIAAAGGMEVVMHMAFDSTKEPIKSLATLKELGVDRILTHGGPEQTKIEDNIPTLKKYFKEAGNDLQILPGGGINTKNRELIAKETGSKQLHGTKIV